MESLRPKQFSYLKQAKKKELRCLVSGVLKLIKNENTRQRQKYVHILCSLSTLGLVCVPDEVYKKALPKGISGMSEILCKVKLTVSADINKPKTVLVLPKHKDIKEADHIITFEKFANVIEKRGFLGERFAKSLRRWAKHPAGSVLPGTKCP